MMRRRIVFAAAIGLAWASSACDESSPGQCFSNDACGACSTCVNGACVDDQEICDDGLDNDCDNEVDEGCTDACDGLVCSEPPEPECTGADTVRVYSANGSCQAGACTYPHTDTTCASGCNTDRGACDDCVDACLDGTAQCTSGQLRGCVRDDRGCRIWSQPIDCADGFCQDAETCGTCTHQCPSIGTSDCTEGAVRVCVEDDHGCREWSTPVPCPTGSCASGTSCTTCNNTCAREGETQCTAGTIQQCELGSDGCLSWGAPAACPSSQCLDTHSCQGCSDECPALNATECSTGQIRTCGTGALGCLAWGEYEACVDGFCASATACGTDPCIGETTCAAQNRLCENQAGTPVCGACVAGFHDDGGACVADVAVTLQFHETSYDLTDTHFVSDLVGWAVGWPHWDAVTEAFRSTIIKTEDGGVTWTAQETPLVRALRGVFFVDESIGFAIGTDGTLLKTTNGGATWIDKSIAAVEHDLRGVAFTDADHGWVTGVLATHFDTFGDADDWRGAVWYTEDGGDSWNKQTLPEDAGIASILNRVAFVDDQTGWIAGIQFVGYSGPWPEHEAAVYRTVNGGGTWTLWQPPETSIVLTGVDFIDASNGWVVGFKMNSGVAGGTVFSTSDGGETWQAHDPDYVLWDVEFIDASRGYAVGTMYGAAWGPPVLRTQDGGETWEMPIMDQHDGEGLYGLAVSGSRVVAVGDDDFCARSTDPWGTLEWPHGGNLFSQAYLNPHFQFEEVLFVSDQVGWAVGKRSWAPSLWGQVIMATQDSGDTWSVQYESPPDLDGLFSYTYRLDSISFADSSHGWAVGGSEQHVGAILRTDDGGAHWGEQGSELYDSWDLEFFAVDAIDAQEAWALAASRFPESTIYLAHTTNGGAAWQWVDTGVEGMLSAGYAYVQGGMAFADAQHGWAGGGAGMVVHTGDGGDTWQAQILPNEYGHVQAVTAVSDLVGWVAGEYLFRTNDGGTSWSAMAADVGEVFDIQAVDATHGWLVAAGGAIAFTLDGGDSWQTVDPVLAGDDLWTYAARFHTLFGLSMSDATRGWAVGEHGAIFKVEASLP